MTHTPDTNKSPLRGDELFPVVDPDGNVLGCATRELCHSGGKVKLLHPVVHLHLLGHDGSIYLQKRVLTKDIQPGKWDTAVGGHVDYKEPVYDALLREAREELDFDASGAVFVTSYVFESDRERELVNVYASRVSTDVELHPEPSEIECGSFWSEAEVAQAMGKGLLTPNFESEYKRIRPLLDNLI